MNPHRLTYDAADLLAKTYSLLAQVQHATGNARIRDLKQRVEALSLEVREAAYDVPDVRLTTKKGGA